MINKEKLYSVLEGYKSYFPEHWKDEKYKWEAVKCFQENWDIEAEDFGEMFKRATAKTQNLLASNLFYPRQRILNFIEDNIEDARNMFINLYDEKRDLKERVEEFKKQAEIWISKHDEWKSHYQNTNTISIYLWLRYPEKYYIYKHDIVVDISQELESDFVPKRNGKAETMIEGFHLYDEINKVILEDEEINQLYKQFKTDDCYDDPYLRTVTMDVGFYLSRYYLTEKEEDHAGIRIWKISEGTNATGVPKEYRQKFEQTKVVVVNSQTKAKGGAKKSQGKDFIDGVKKGDFFYLCYGNDIQLLGRFTEEGAVPNKEIGGSWYERKYELIAESVNKEPYKGMKKWWTPNDNSTCIMIHKSEEDLFEKLILKPYFDLELEQLLKKDRKYWWLSADPEQWRFSELDVGEEQYYTLYNHNGNKRKIFSNFMEAKEGDLLLCYESSPTKSITGIAEITKEQDGEKLYFKKKEGFSSPLLFDDIKECNELKDMEFNIQCRGSLFKLTKGEFDFIMAKIREENLPEPPYKTYTKEDFLNDVYMSEERYDILAGLLKNKKNIILQGAPGVGKTFSAKKLAYSLMGKEDDSKIELIQFHQNYSYEDFVMGYRPQGSDFVLKKGIFLQFCEKAAQDQENEYFFIIDEINRGNMSKIFGELLMTIEKDYRETEVKLAYSGEKFSVPKNLYIIGMMNTADRSLAMIDYALRRRFSFFEMQPGFLTEGFLKYQRKLNKETFNKLISQIIEINKEIVKDHSLGKGFQIGHSYFCSKEREECTIEWMRSVVEFDIIPTLSEYWFDDPEKLDTCEKELRGVFDDE